MLLESKMILGSELVLGVFTLAYVFAFVQQCMNPKPQTTPAVVAQMTLAAVVVGMIGVMIAVARDPMLSFSPKRVASFIS